ncbi:MAG: pilus assembly FimT family protein [Desulfosalsimonas sp.]
MKKTFKKIRHRQVTSPCRDKEALAFCTSGSGFTILELVAVLLILGIITAVAISKYSDTNTTDIAAANTFKSHLRYAHLRAMGDTVSWGIEIETTAYTLQKNGSKAQVNLPGEDSAKRTLEGTTISPKIDTDKDPVTVTFDRGRGIPIFTTDENGDPINEFEVGSETITITEFTGFIP